MHRASHYSFSFFALLLFALAGVLFITQQSKVPQDIEEASDVPLTYSLPKGWRSERTSHDTSSIMPFREERTKTEVIDIYSPYPDESFPEFVDPFLSFSWFPFDPRVSLEETVSLLHPLDEKNFDKVELAGKDAVHMTSYGDRTKPLDGEPPAYRVDEYLVRFEENSLFYIQVLYNTASSFEDHHDEIQTIVDSIEFIPVTPEKSQEPFEVPFTYTVPQGWQEEQTRYEMNTLPGGGPMNAVILASPYADENFDDTSDPKMIFFWFHFNPDASLEDIAPLLSTGAQSQILKETIGGKQTIHVIYESDSTNPVDGEPPAYRIDEYLLRLDDGSLFRLQAIFQTKGRYDAYGSEVSAITDSLTFEQKESSP